IAPSMRPTRAQPRRFGQSVASFNAKLGNAARSVRNRPVATRPPAIHRGRKDGPGTPSSRYGAFQDSTNMNTPSAVKTSPATVSALFIVFPRVIRVRETSRMSPRGASGQLADRLQHRGELRPFVGEVLRVIRAA